MPGLIRYGRLEKNRIVFIVRPTVISKKGMYVSIVGNLKMINIAKPTIIGAITARMLLLPVN